MVKMKARICCDCGDMMFTYKAVRSDVRFYFAEGMYVLPSEVLWNWRCLNCGTELPMNDDEIAYCEEIDKGEGK